MARITVPFSGLTSNANHKDGECSNLVNLRPKNGYLKPVAPRKISHPLSQEYEIIFVHRIGSIENWIGVSGKNIYSYINTPTPTLIGSTSEVVNSVQQIGNTLSFITSTNTYYALWIDQAYIYLGELPHLHNVKFSTDPMVTKGKFYSSEYEGALAYPKTDDERVVFTEKTIGLVKLLLDEEGSRGYFHDAFLIRYAYRLYDGTILRPSSPILVMPQEHYTEWGKAYLTRTGTSDNYDNGAKVNLKMFKLIAEYSFPADMEKWKDIIKSVDFFTSKYIGLANPDSISNFFMTFPSTGGINIYKQSDKGFGERHIADQRPTGGRTQSPNRGTPIGGSSSSSSSNRQSSNQGLVETAKVEFVDTPEDKVVSASQFYLYYSDEDYLTPKTGSDKLVLPNSKVSVKGNFYNIINQEMMPDDTLSHHSVGAFTSSVYNNRLRLSQIRTTLFKGFHPNHFQWGSLYNGEPSSWHSGSRSVRVEVTINTDVGSRVLLLDDNVSVFLGAFISYPDPRASEIKIVRGMVKVGDVYLVEGAIITLSPHPYLNIAYAINDDLKPFKPNGDITKLLGSGFPRNTVLEEPNKLKVSEINNPFVFPNLNTYQIGSGKILNESSIIMNVSDRNYGMYPVFVFTDNGVFTMAGQTADTVHDSVQAPTYLEPPISDKICATPYGVVFITKRGLMMISQHETVSLSPQLREVDDDIAIHDINEIPGDIIHYPHSSFTDFLKSTSSIVYNPYNDELIITSSLHPYSYVYDFPSKSFYLSTEKFSEVVQNAFPDLYVVDGVEIKDYSQPQTKAADVSIITRPLSFGTTDIKTLSRVWLRALMYNTRVMSVAAFHSIDGVNFFPIKGLTFGQRHGNYLDTDLGLLSRSTYKHYMLIINGTVDEETQIRYSEYEVDKRYNNDKMR